MCFTPMYSGQFLGKCLALRAKDVVAGLDDLEDAAIDRFALMNAREGNLACHADLLRE